MGMTPPHVSISKVTSRIRSLLSAKPALPGLGCVRILAGFLMCLSLAAQTPPERPKILGVAHYAIYVSDLAKARAFYEDFLGYQVAFSVPKPDGSVDIAYVKINDHQWLELVNEPTHGEGQLVNLALYTNNVEQMQRYLSSRGVKVQDHVMRDPAGDKMISVVDPDGYTLEFIEYMRDSLTGKDKGKHMPDTRISEEIGHAGILVGNLTATEKFYEGILGLHDSWRGNSPASRTLQYVNMDVPDGDEHVAIMLYKELLPPDKRGTELHYCLILPNIIRTVAILQARAATIHYTREISIGHGFDGNYEANLWDPDGTRTELMEYNSPDGKPVYAPFSTLPPPR